MGCDFHVIDFIPITEPISIHAPAWGATAQAGAAVPTGRFQSTHPHGVRPRARAYSFRAPRHFNPRTRMGCDTVRVIYSASRARFQSTHPHGVRPKTMRRAARKHSISIHAPAWGATILRLPSPLLLQISIHAPAWGATLMVPVSHEVASISIHAPAWGATWPSGSIPAAHGNFNPRTRMGCDPSKMHRFFVCKYFNPRTRMGCDAFFRRFIVAQAFISIHAPAWGATFNQTKV